MNNGILTLGYKNITFTLYFSEGVIAGVSERERERQTEVGNEWRLPH